MINPVQPGGPAVGSFHQTPCKFNGKWVGMLWNREVKGAGRPPGPGLAPLGTTMSIGGGAPGSEGGGPPGSICIAAFQIGQSEPAGAPKFAQVLLECPPRCPSGVSASRTRDSRDIRLTSHMWRVMTHVSLHFRAARREYPYTDYPETAKSRTDNRPTPRHAT